MLSLIYPGLKLLQLKGSPADLPYQPSWLAGLLLAYVSLTVVLYQLLATPSGLQAALGAAILHLLFVRGVLWLRSRSARWVQTMTGLFTIWLLLDLLLVPPILVLAALGVKLELASSAAGGQTASSFLELLLVALLVWRLLAEGHVLRIALELPYAAALVIALSLLIVESSLLQLWLSKPA